MLLVIYFLAISAVALLSFTRHRIFVVCGFYCFYALLSVLDPGNVPRVGPMTVFRALYLVAFVSCIARLVQDRTFVSQMRRWSAPSYFSLLFLILASALYSQTSGTFASASGSTVWDALALVSLFWMCAAQVQREVDLKIVAGTTVVVSLVLSVWVIWNAAQLDFTGFRGGIEVNQNYVSLFTLVGAISLCNIILTGKRFLVRLLFLLPLLCIVSASVILASLGMLAAFAVGLIWMAATALRGRSRRTLVGVAAALVLVFGIAMLLPGSGSLLARFREGDLGTLDQRTVVWSQSIKYFNASNLARMTFGQGLSSATFVLEPFVTSDLLNYHNQYLEYLMEQGVVGLTVFLMFLYAMIRRVTRSHHPRKHLMLGWMGILMVAGLSSTVADSQEFWILVGVMAGVCSLANVSTESAPLALAPPLRNPSSGLSSGAILEG